MTYDADVQVGGLIASVGQRMLGGVSKMMLDQFFSRMTELLAVASRRSAVHASPAPAGRPALGRGRRRARSRSRASARDPAGRPPAASTAPRSPAPASSPTAAPTTTAASATTTATPRSRSGSTPPPGLATLPQPEVIWRAATFAEIRFACGPACTRQLLLRSQAPPPLRPTSPTCSTVDLAPPADRAARTGARSRSARSSRAARSPASSGDWAPGLALARRSPRSASIPTAGSRSPGSGRDRTPVTERVRPQRPAVGAVAERGMAGGRADPFPASGRERPSRLRDSSSEDEKACRAEAHCRPPRRPRRGRTPAEWAPRRRPEPRGEAG